MLTCREFADFLMAYLDGELPEGQRTEFQTHLDICPPCVHYLETYEETVRLGKACCAPDDGPPPVAAPAPLNKAILAARRKG